MWRFLVTTLVLLVSSCTGHDLGAADILERHGPGAASSGMREQRPPNVVISFADDLGYGDLSCFGNPTIHTSNIDRLAAEGIRFTDAHAPAALCVPSR